jgi:hypothetical protein
MSGEPAATPSGDKPELLDHLKEIFKAGFWRNWTILGVARWIATLLAMLIGVVFLGTLLVENFRDLIESHHWNSFLTRWVAAMSDLFTYPATWPVTGFVFGLAAVLWLIWAFPHRLGDQHSLPKSTRKKWRTAVVAILVVGLTVYSAITQPSPVPVVVHDPPSEAQKTAAAAPLVESAKREAKAQIDAANKTRDEAGNAASRAADLERKLNDAQHQLTVATGERDDAKRALFIARANAGPKPPPPASFANYLLTEDQIHNIADEVYQIQSMLPKQIQIDRIMYNSESVGLGGQIGRAIDLGGIVPALNWNRPKTPRDTGLRIRVPDLNSKPVGVEKLAQILKEVTGVDVPFEAS